MSDADCGKFMKQVVSVEYDMKMSPEMVAYSRELAQHRIVGHRCPECGLTYVPGNGYCPICAVAIGPDGHVELEPRGTVTTFTVVEPVQYNAQCRGRVAADLGVARGNGRCLGAVGGLGSTPARRSGRGPRLQLGQERCPRFR